MAIATTTGLRLPEELIWIIIQQTDDLETLQNWCAATTRHEDLHMAALQKIWADVTISHNDLVASPDEVQLSIEQGSRYKYNETSNGGQRPSRNNLVNCTGLINLATKALLPAAVPASCITHLNFNFRFDHDAEQPEYRYNYNSTGPPGETLEHSIALLFPYLKKVESITVDCKMPQKLLNAVTTFTCDQLKVLMIRISFTNAYFCSPGRSRLCLKHLLEWEELRYMALLETLEIRELAFGEGDGLALAVRELRSLKRLLIKTDTQPDSWNHEPYSSPLQGFFDKTFLTDNSIGMSGTASDRICGLPVTLQSLVLLDSFYRGSRGATVRAPPLNYRSPHQFLTEVSVDLYDHNSFFNIIKWFSESPLSTIRVPSDPINPLSKYQSTPTAETLQLKRFISTVIYESQNLLSELILLDAWKIEPGLCELLNNTLENRFIVEELVLGSRDPRSYGRYVSTRNSMLENNDIVGSRSWGSKLKRLRVMHIDLHKLELDCLASPDMANLRILMLDSLPQDSSSDSAQQRFPAPETTPEGCTAVAIASESLSCLRVLVIGVYRFWIHLASTPVVMYLADAQKHPDHCTEVESWLTVDDRSFLNGDVPYIPLRDRLAEKRRLTSSGPLVDSIRARLSNYLVLRRTT